jgi:hypothetical protein
MRGFSRNVSLLRALAPALLIGSLGCTGEMAGDEKVNANREACVVEEAPRLLDVNDVSVLFPFDRTTGTFSPDLPLDAFMSREVFDQVIAASRTVRISHADPLGSDVYENWRIVSFRFDPCSPSPTLASGTIPPELEGVVPGCIVNLRLVAQPVALRGPGAPPLGGQANPVTTVEFPEGVKAPQDFALHLVYNLGLLQGSPDTETLRASFAASLPLVNGLQAIKAASTAIGADTDGALLGVHPGLAREQGATLRPVSEAITAYLTSVLNPQRLSFLAFMGVPAGRTAPWIFFNGAVVPGADGVPSFVHLPMQGFASPLMAETLPSLVSARGEPLGFPDVPLGPLSLAHIARPSTDPVEAVRAAFDIENPLLTHALGLDCASCHGVHTVKNGMPPNLTGIRSVSDLPATRFLAPPGVTAYSSTEAAPRNDWNVHNLGYLGVAPKVSERTLNETTEVVDLVNRLLAGDGHRNPGLDCGDDRAQLDQIYVCQQVATMAGGADRDACFSACTIRGQNP